MKHFFVRLMNLIFGLFLFAIGVVVNIKANIGYAPWEIFHVGLASTLGLSIGVASIIVGFAMVVTAAVFREKIGLGAIAGMTLTGIFIDIILKIDILPTAESFPAGLIMLIIGLFILAFGSYFYMRSAFGAGPRDCVMVVLVRKTKLPIGVCRGMLEVAVTIAGWLLGGMFGVGTVISAIVVGACVQIVFGLFKFDVTAVKNETLVDTYMYLSGKRERGK